MRLRIVLAVVLILLGTLALIYRGFNAPGRTRLPMRQAV